jgi:2-methylaconitate cis-trans-isomerase PrpF
MRGGTSRGAFFHASDLPSDPTMRDRMLMAVIGGPDPRQVDGIGSADLLLSKVAVVWPSARPDVDVECRFGSVTPGSAIIKYGANCGNLSSAVACFAREEGLVDPFAETVRIYNPESGTKMEARFCAAGGRCTATIQGMPPTGQNVELALLDPVGTANSTLLPTGRAVDYLALPDGQPLSVSIVDAGALYVFIRAEDLQIASTARSDRFMGDAGLMELLEHLRGQAAVLAGLVSDPSEALGVTPAVPKLALVGPPVDYQTEGTNLPVSQADIDLVGRIISSQSVHKAYAVTGAVATSAAALLRGSVLEGLVRGDSNGIQRRFCLGHPTGIVEITIGYTGEGSAMQIRHATLLRTARRIMEGWVYLPETLGDGQHAAGAAVAGLQQQMVTA